MNYSKDCCKASLFDKQMLADGVRDMINEKRLRYTSITKRYFGQVKDFGGVTITIFREGSERVHKTVLIRPYADTGQMDNLEMYLDIPEDVSKKVYLKWCRETQNSDAHQENLELLQGRLTLAAIEAMNEV